VTTSSAGVEASAALSYPIGRFQYTPGYTPEQRAKFIDEIAAAPAQLRDAVRGLSEQQLDTPYRPQGWTVRQVVHHVPESHMNAYIRFKWALTEDNPLIKAYEEARWAETPEVAKTPTEVSLRLLEALHERWVPLLRVLSAEQYQTPYVHPENGPMNLERMLGLYAWHGKHHVAHITELRKRMGW
jgi:uncharacterized damage-inducible protein DinB